MACSIHPMPHRPTAWTHAPRGTAGRAPPRRRPPRPATRGTGRAVRRCPRPGRGRYTEKTARPRRCGGQPDELRQGQRFGRAGVQPSKQRRRVRAPPSEPGSVRDAFFQHGLHARTEARSLGEQAVSLGQRVVFRINARFRAVERQPASRPQGKPERVGRLVQRQEYRIQLMPSVGAHPRNPQGQVHLASDPQCRRFHRSVIHPNALPARVALFV